MLQSARGDWLRGLGRTYHAGGWSSYLVSVAVIVFVGVVLRDLGLAGSQVIGAIPLLFLVVLVAWTWGQTPAIVAALAGSLTFNYFLVPPAGFSKPTPEEGVVLIAFLAAAVSLGRVTDRVKAAREEAEESAASERFQKTLLNCVSHNLRTPLTAVMGSLSTLMIEGDHLEQGVRRELMGMAYAGAKTLDIMIAQLLEIARLEGRTMEMRFEGRHLSEVVRVALDQLGEFRERRYHVDLPPDLPKIPIDIMLLTHAVTNILDNAARYSSRYAPIEIKAHNGRERIVLSVADRGVGIPVEHLDRIFEKFYRLKYAKGASEALEGSGLGLAISKSIVEAHRGRIWAERRPGGGTIVSMSLPLT
jgi:two-component system, OmpR family, sensor histidine kinase KdpD